MCPTCIFHNHCTSIITLYALHRLSIGWNAVNRKTTDNYGNNSISDYNNDYK